MLGLKLNHVSKRSPRQQSVKTWSFHDDHTITSHRLDHIHGEVAPKYSSLMNESNCHYSTSTVMEQLPVCSSISKRNDVGDCEKSPSSSIMFTISKICNGVTQNTTMQNLPRNSTCYGIYETVNKSLCTNELWDICQVYNSPTDGQCLLHSVVSSLKHQLVHNVGIDTNYLLTVISCEISQHPERYLCFIKIMIAVFYLMVLGYMPNTSNMTLFLVITFHW